MAALGLTKGVFFLLYIAHVLDIRPHAVPKTRTTYTRIGVFLSRVTCISDVM